MLKEWLEYKDGMVFWKRRKGRVPAGCRAGYLSSNGYRYIRIDMKMHTEHRVIWYLFHGYWPEEIDHINGDRADNRIENLRECSSAQNKAHRRGRSSSLAGFKGVNWMKDSGNWKAVITFEGKTTYLGSFKCKFDAATAYNFAVAQHHGEFAVYNTVPQPWLDVVMQDAKQTQYSLEVLK